MIDFFSSLSDFFSDTSSFFVSIFSDLLSSIGDVLNFIKVICWDVPHLILSDIIPNVPYVFRVPLYCLFLTIITIFFMKLIKVLIKDLIAS